MIGSDSSVIGQGGLKAAPFPFLLNLPTIFQYLSHQCNRLIWNVFKIPHAPQRLYMKKLSSPIQLFWTRLYHPSRNPTRYSRANDSSWLLMLSCSMAKAICDPALVQQGFVKQSCPLCNSALIVTINLLFRIILTIKVKEIDRDEKYKVSKAASLYLKVNVSKYNSGSSNCKIRSTTMYFKIK